MLQKRESKKQNVMKERKMKKKKNITKRERKNQNVMK